MQGNSWLGVSQINHAARDCHPALKCIAPWEGHAVSICMTSIKEAELSICSLLRTTTEMSWFEVVSRRLLLVIGCKASWVGHARAHV